MLSHANPLQESLPSPLSENPEPRVNQSVEALSPDEVQAAAETAAGFIAPTWPLDRFIAVNPFWGMTDKPVAEVDAALRARSGARLLMPRRWFKEAYDAGTLRDEHLRTALDRADTPIPFEELLAALDRDEPKAPKRLLAVDAADNLRDPVYEMSWRELVTFSLSQFCASFFDDGQSQLSPNREGGLYASWRRQALEDKGPQLLKGMDRYPELVNELPHSALKTIEMALRDLEVPGEESEAYLHALLLDLNGWASWCAYRRWTAELEGKQEGSIVDLLAMRIAWDWLLHQEGGEKMAQTWRRAMINWPKVDVDASKAQSVGWLLQDAIEIAWQEPVIAAIPEGLEGEAPESAAVQAAFCIDVRSEVFRRALEKQSEDIQTIGFAGFFGMPIEYQPLGSDQARPQLPGLLAPQLRATDTGVRGELVLDRANSLEAKSAWAALKSGAVSTFMFVEAMGLHYAAKLFKDGFSRNAPTKIDLAGLSPEAAQLRKPRLTERADGTPLDTASRCDLAAGILRAMGLRRNFAPIVLLAGHGSETRNNPHAAGLDCGACCGQTGEVNARAVASLLNDADVRAGLTERGIEIPARTHFIGGLHNTTTDEVALFDEDELPSSHRDEVIALKAWLAGASRIARNERAPLLGIAAQSANAQSEAILERGRDWAQVRPEWGLTNNAAFIIAPREHTRHLDLGGRSFLHDYRYRDDEDLSILELLMTAPMVVTHWINFQYYASTVDNQHYGSGNKVLHNVVGGHLGLFEGNGGDLRIGLPMQSLHDGSKWVHNPLRLSVFIEAPRSAIDQILGKHPNVQSLFDHGWMHLFQIDDAEKAIHSYRDQTWLRAADTFQV